MKDESTTTFNLAVSMVRIISEQGSCNLELLADQLGVEPKALFPVKEMLVQDGMIRRVSNPAYKSEYDEHSVPYELNL